MSVEVILLFTPKRVEYCYQNYFSTQKHVVPLFNSLNERKFTRLHFKSTGKRLFLEHQN